MLRIRIQLLAMIAAVVVLSGCQANGAVRAEAPEIAAATPVQATLEGPVVSVEGIDEYRLSNGLKVVLVPDSSQPQTTVNITYFVGSRHEAYGESGMAHLLEHLVFQGTPTFPDITREISERGGRANGTTWYDRTNYFQTFPANEDNLDWALRMEADRMVNSFISAEDLASEMTVVRNEFEGGENNPFQVLLQRVMSTAYLWHGYGRSTIGARADLENVPIERLQSFYRKYYQPDNAMLVVAGRFDTQDVLERIGRHFGVLQAPERSGDMILWDTYTREPAQDGERLVTLRRVGDLQLIMSSYHIPAGSHPDAAPLALLANVIGNAPSGRLHKALVETGLAAGVGSFAFTLAEPSPMLSFAQVRLDQDLDEVRQVFIETLDDVLANPPTEAELERARAASLRSFELTLNDSQRIGVSLTEWAATGDWRLLFLARDRIAEVSLDDLQRVAREYLKPSNRTVGLFVPDSEPDRATIPEAPDLQALLADYEGGESRSEGESFDATPENIESRLVRIDLANGLSLGLLPKQTRGSRVVGSITMPIATESGLMGKSTSGDLAGSMLMRGTRQRSREALQDSIAQLGAALNVGGSGKQLGGGFQTTRENLPAVLRLMAEVLREPAFDASEFEELRRASLASIEANRSEPGFVANNALQRHLNNYPPEHPNYVQSADEMVAAMNAAEVEAARAFHQRFHGIAPGSRLVLIGDFDVDEVRSLVEETLGDWTAEVPFERFSFQTADVAPLTLEQLQTPDKSNAILRGSIPLAMRDDHPDVPALTIGNYMLGGGFLSSRLSQRIRTDEGISYGVGSGFSAHPIDEYGSIGFYAMFAPENRDRLLAALREELDKVLDQGFTQQELDSARTGWLQSREVSRGNDPELAGQVAQNIYLGRTMLDQAEFEAKVMALTPDDVHQAMRRHLDLERLSLVIAGDFED